MLEFFKICYSAHTYRTHAKIASVAPNSQLSRVFHVDISNCWKLKKWIYTDQTP